MPALCCLASLQSIPWKKVLALLLLFTFNFALMTAYILFSDFASWMTALLVSFVFAVGTSILYYASSKFRCALVVSLTMCFTKGGLGVFFFFGSWMFASPNLASVTQILMDIEEHSRCLAGHSKNYTENEDITWHISMVQLIGGVIHYAFILPLILLVVYSFVFVLTFKVARRAVSTNSNENRTKVKLLQAFLLSMSKAGSFLIGGAFFITLFLIYFRGVFSRMSAIDAKLPNASCSFVQEKAKWTIAIAYLVFSLVILVLSQFSSFALKFREEIMLAYYPDDSNTLRAAAVPAVITNLHQQIPMEEPLRARPLDVLADGIEF